MSSFSFTATLYATTSKHSPRAFIQRVCCILFFWTKINGLYMRSLQIIQVLLLGNFVLNRCQVWSHVLVHQHGGRRRVTRHAVRMGLLQHLVRRVRRVGIPSLERGCRGCPSRSKSFQAEGNTCHPMYAKTCVRVDEVDTVVQTRHNEKKTLRT